MNYMDIDGYTVTGQAEGGDHAWNSVQLDDGKYYLLDCTWDYVIQGDEFFARGSDLFGREHTMDTPQGDPTHFLPELPAMSRQDFDREYYVAHGSEPVKGDINGDGEINVTDVVLAAAHVKSIRALEGDWLARADINGDGDVNVTDLTWIAAFVKGLIK
ncbi:MAG: hypothetical protein IJ063_16255 [Ruminococcus sp.]|nr:hypothetical protein [Ruminococcus sp.]MBQ8968096.1 hypothetical protein [Ruminococcus sp.]